MSDLHRDSRQPGLLLFFCFEVRQVELVFSPLEMATVAEDAVVSL